METEREALRRIAINVECLAFIKYPILNYEINNVCIHYCHWMMLLGYLDPTYEPISYKV